MKGLKQIESRELSAARPALFVGGWALSQLWIFWLAPIVGALAAGWLYKGMLEIRAEPDIAGRP
jgi:aquaporin Z